MQETLEIAQRQLQDGSIDKTSVKAIEPVIRSCQEKAKAMLEIFQQIEKAEKDAKDAKAAKDGPVLDLYRKTVLRLGKAHRVEALMQDILKGLKALAINQLFKLVTQDQIARLEKAIQELSEVEPSVPDSDFETAGTMNVNQNIAAGGKGNQAINRGENQDNTFGNKFQSGGGPMSFGMGFHE